MEARPPHLSAAEPTATRSPKLRGRWTTATTQPPRPRHQRRRTRRLLSGEWRHAPPPPLTQSKPVLPEDGHQRRHQGPTPDRLQGIAAALRKPVAVIQRAAAIQYLDLPGHRLSGYDDDVRVMSPPSGMTGREAALAGDDRSCRSKFRTSSPWRSRPKTNRLQSVVVVRVAGKLPLPRTSNSGGPHTPARIGGRNMDQTRLLLQRRAHLATPRQDGRMPRERQLQTVPCRVLARRCRWPQLTFQGLLAGGQWFQLWRGEIVSMHSPELREFDARIHRGPLANQAPSPATGERRKTARYGKGKRYRVAGIPGVRDRSFEKLGDANAWKANAEHESRIGEFVDPRGAGSCSRLLPGALLACPDRGSGDAAATIRSRSNPISPSSAYAAERHQGATAADVPRLPSMPPTARTASSRRGARCLRFCSQRWTMSGSRSLALRRR